MTPTEGRLQQNGTPVNYNLDMRQFLDQQLPGIWIGRGEETP